MKKIVSLFLVLAMLLSLAACTQKKEATPSVSTVPSIPSSEELAPGEIPGLGQLINGFRVTAIQPGLSRDITFVYMEHEKTGAKLVYAANHDTNRNFTIGFRTPSINDKGIPHVFEHSVLCGSEKYPDPSLFFSMVNNTYTSYLNASTYPTMTCFPASSLSLRISFLQTWIIFSTAYSTPWLSQMNGL